MNFARKIYPSPVNDKWSVKANLTMERSHADYRLDSFLHRQHRKTDMAHRDKKCRTAENMWFDYNEMVEEFGKGKIASIVSNLPNRLWERTQRKPARHHERYLAKKDICLQEDDMAYFDEEGKGSFAGQ